MALVVLTGGARSGKSGTAQRLVASCRGAAVAAVAAHDSADGEMARRIGRHREDRPVGFDVLEVHEDDPFLDRVPTGACLLVDCLGTIVAGIVGSAFGRAGETAASGDLVSEEVEAAVEREVGGLVAGLLARTADTVVVTNEVGDGVVPAYPDARLFRDVLGRANRRLVDEADAAYLVVAGRCIDLATLPTEARWPTETTKETL